jgi:hypothetical protein
MKCRYDDAFPEMEHEERGDDVGAKTKKKRKKKKKKNSDNEMEEV